MSNIVHVELTDTFNKQRQVLNEVVDYVNANPIVSGGNGISISEENVISVKTSGDGLSIDASGNLVGNDAYANLLTQVVLDPSVPLVSPSVTSSTTILFPAFKVLFGKKVYYGKEIADFEEVNVPQTTMTVESGVDGAVFVYVDNLGVIHQSLSSVTPGNSSIQCLLGSYFRLNNQIQEDSWKYTPWNGSTSKDSRFMNSSSLSGGLMVVTSANTLARGEVAIIYEGVNVSSSLYLPNQISYESESPYVTKKLWPGYDASVLDVSTLDTTHVYNISDDQVDDVSNLNGYIILIPGIVAPTGQDVYLMAQSPYANSTYSQIFDSMESAEAAIYGLELEFGNVASRVAWLGQSIIVKIGATDFTDKNQLRIIGNVPNVIKAYESLSGAGASTRVEGLTIASNGSTVGTESSKTLVNFDDSFTVANTSENSVTVTAVDQLTPKMANCLTQIPQNIKLEFSAGTITLKANSKSYRPNGAGVFTERVNAADVSLSAATADGDNFVFYNGTALTLRPVTSCYSSTTAPTDIVQNATWYDLTNNSIKDTADGGSTWTSDAKSLPLGIVTCSSGSITGLKTTLNGFGYIGSTIYALPGISGLIPNGRNSDGSLKNTPFSTNSILLYTLDGGTFGGRSIIMNSAAISFATSVSYDEAANQMSVGSYVDVGIGSAISGVVTEFSPRTAFHAVDYGDYEKIISIQGRLLQQNISTNWPLTTNPDEWPHNVFLTTDSDVTISSTVPQFNTANPKILTWEVVIQNTNQNAPISITWPAVYQPFNAENLLTTIAPNTTVFMMMRRYSNNYTLVSHQGTQVNSTI